LSYDPILNFEQIMKFDVAIVGAGPAGSWLARELAKNNISVVLFERSPVIGEPNFSSAGSPAYTVERFRLPPASVAARWDILRINGPTTTFSWRYDTPIGVVFDFRELKVLLLKEAEKMGAIIKLGSTVENVKILNDYSEIYVKSEKEAYRAKVVVDASGPSGVIATRLGMRKAIPIKPSVGLEIIAETPQAPIDVFRTLDFYFGRVWVPHGYGWIFPMMKPCVKIGVGVFQLARYGGGPRLEDFLNELIKRVPYLSGHHIVETHGGMLYGMGIRHHVFKNVIAIGDAADQVNPLGGEGIRHALQSAEFARDVILDAIAKNDLARLEQYDIRWRKYIGWRWWKCRILAQFFYHHFSDSMHDNFVRAVSKITAQEIFDALFEYKIWPSIHARLFKRHTGY